ncbi:K(+)/H(+) antiporter subunit KhtT [Neomoorella glycerini]|uniref:K(+)/H(+) antiporter subunit KhtT n=1 Tax=Neomoorella glycerini TaxID=55779 RepID=A0A6I5ZUR1_9FIRM|nr:cation:proton antiporter regulatory subunit [Moorella glycerini]QGP93792.1 K(+)/H(+) antiporter subunit KhtT [Moorella glycerini]
MLPLREIELPGIGRKFQLNTRSGEQLVIIIHEDGKRELYLFNPGNAEECTATVTLNDQEARQVGAILGGVVYKPTALEEAEVELDQLVIDWYKVETGAVGVGKTIGGLKVREQTGATIIAVIESDHTTHITPGPDQVIAAHCTLVLAGTREAVKACKRLILHGSL